MLTTAIVIVAVLAMIVPGLVVKRHALSGGSKTKALSRKRTAEDCDMFITRIFEQRLIDAGIDTTLSKCSDPECVACSPKPLRAPVPPKGPAGIASQRRAELPRNTVHHCRDCANIVMVRGNLCRECLQKALAKRRADREKENRYRTIDFQGTTYRAQIPDGVPTNAFLEIVNDTATFATWAHWRWVDDKTGKTMGLKSTAFEVERHEIRSGNGDVVREIFAPVLRTERIWK